MCQPRKWWQGIVPLSFLWLLTIWFNTPGVEHDLTERASKSLTQAKLDQPRLTFQGRDGVLAGHAFSDLDQKAAVAALGRVDGVRLVVDATSLVEETRPYGFSAQRLGDVLTLTGALPDPSAKGQLITRLHDIFSQAKLDDQTRWARGAPELFLPFALFGLEQLAQLSAGSIQLSDAELTLVGTADTRSAYDGVLDALKRVPDGLSLARVEIAPPLADPFLWRALRDTNHHLVLSGNVPPGAGRVELLDAARGSMPEADVRDEMVESRGALPAFSLLAPYGFDMLAKMTQGSVSVSGNRITIDGDAATSQDFVALVDGLKKLPAGGLLQEAAIRPPLAALYSFEAVRTDDSLKLEGYVPTPAVREMMIGAAARLVPGVVIDDHMAYAAGEPTGFVTASLWGLDQLHRLTEGRLTISGLGISLSGTAPDEETRQSVEQALAAVPTGFLLLSANLTAPEPPSPPTPSPQPVPQAPLLPALPPSPQPAPSPPALSALPSPPVSASSPLPSASFNPAIVTAAAEFSAMRADGKLTLAGIYLDERAHEEIIDAAQRAFFAEAILDQMARSDKAPKLLAQAALAGLGALARLEGGFVTIRDANVRITGDAFYERAAEQIRTDLKGNLPATFHAESAIAVKPPIPLASIAACQKLFSSLVARGKILFDSGRATVSRDSTGLLDFIVHAALRCPQATIEIDGHTDSDGNADANLDLSKRRAQSVVDYLAKAGIDPSKLTAVGFGDTRPIADNSNEEGKAENRRIEFIVR